LGLHWPGYRKVRRRLCKKIGRRLRELSIPTASQYQTYLERHPGEWGTLSKLAPITISLFYRDRGVFELLEREIIPSLARLAMARGDRTLHCWSAGCACGEEPYSLSILWQRQLQQHFPTLSLRILATDIDPRVLESAASGCYESSSLKDLPKHWADQAFTRSDYVYCVREEYRSAVKFECQDIRASTPQGPFDLILCRNVAFTYFEPVLQAQVMARLVARLRSGAALVIGNHEALPGQMAEIQRWPSAKGTYRKALGSEEGLAPPITTGTRRLA
jgi:chemotaxis protein methyltransferase CheR